MRGVPARVVLLLEELNFGGTQRQVLELGSHLDPSRFSVEIWLLTAGNDMASLAQERNVPVRHLTDANWVNPSSLGVLWRLLRSNRTDILVLLTVIPNIWGRLLGRLAKVPVVVATCRQSGGPLRQHDWLLWPLADHHVVNAEDLRTQLTRDFGVPRCRITVIPNGVDTDFFHPAPNPRKGQRKSVLCPARLHPDKDHKTLIAAFKHVAAEHPEVELRIVGNGPHRDIINELVAASGLARKISLIPGQKDLRPYFWDSDLTVLSSIHEGLPNVILEAMACGLPVVATHVSGLPELVEHGKTGLLVPPQNPAALAAAISCLLDDEKLRESFGRSGRETAVVKYSIQSMVKSHESLFTRLLG